MNKLNKTLYILTAVIFLTACELEEDPKFLASDNLFENTIGANSVLNGVYSSLADFAYYGSEYHHALNFTSGLYNSNKKAALLDIAALNPNPATKEIGNYWGGVYKCISRANNLIFSLKDLKLEDEAEQNNILGQAYFIRSLSYFNLIRSFGKCPLVVDPVDSDNPHHPMSDPESIYNQIIADAKLAAQLLPEKGDNAAGRPAKYAANMLLAKVYMQLAANKTAGETNYWQLAYDEAIKVYGMYSLVNDFSSLWQISTANNTVESVFEIQYNTEYPNWLLVMWTAPNVTKGGKNWTRFKPNLEVYDRHAFRYPDDPRLQYTFITEYQSWKGNSLETIETYPSFLNRGNRLKSYPIGYKYSAKDVNMLTTDTELNFVVFRYADLLLMLAEIENELNGPDNAYTYVNEVLARARIAGGINSESPADWSNMSQETFRFYIMSEYLFELLEEGHDWFNVRRRGWEFFRQNVLEEHNNHSDYDFSNVWDVEYSIDDRIMVLPIPNDEISSNLNMDANDQNPGY